MVAACRRRQATPAPSPACGAEVPAPSGGTPRLYLVDEIRLPTRRADFSDDLDGDGRSDNQLGNLVLLADSAGYRPGASLGAMLAAGRIAPRIELVADGAVAGARWRGTPDADATLVSGRFDAGAFQSTRSRCQRHPSTALVLLPLFPDADPLALPAERIEIDLAPDGDGLRGTLRGAFRAGDYLPAAWRAFDQMIRSRPIEHRAIARLLDTDRDGVISLDELRSNAILAELLRPDLHSPDALSFGFAFHARPCPRSGCAPPAPPLPSCDDRLRNGTESDVDCGGACPPCAGGAACRVAADCQSAVCEHATCTEPTCSDRRRDGAESDVDCGGRCAPCDDGRSCRDADDCAGTCRADRRGARREEMLADPRRSVERSETGRCARCTRDADCHALGRPSCAAGACAAASCRNGRRDGNESDVDCGGSCPPCADGRSCRDEADCRSRECERSRCAPRTD